MPHAHLGFLQLLTEMTYPDYRDRHIFTARLRLLILFAFVAFYVYFFAEYVPATHPAVLTIGVACAITLYCYYNIINARWMVASFLIEVIADLTGMTAMIYLMGGVQSDYFILYVCYTLVAGLFYSWRIAVVLGVLSEAAYGVLYLLTAFAWLPGMPGQHAGELLESHHGAWAHPVWLHPVMLGGLLVMAIYATKTAQGFSWTRELALEARNRELMALQRIGATIRSVSSLEEVADRIIDGIMGGLELSGAILWLVDSTAQRLVCYPPRSSRLRSETEALLGVNMRDLSIPLTHETNLVIHQITNRQVVYRRHLEELLDGIEPALNVAHVQRAQEHMQVQKIVVIPLIAEEEVLGALLGFSTEPFLEQRTIDSLQIFADQAALVLRVSLLIDALKKTNDELREVSRVKSEFLATMSHELRTPLTAIIGFSELLLEGAMGALNPEQLESLHEVRNNGANLLELINNILDLSRMESGKLDLTRFPFDVRELVERVLRSVGSLTAKKYQHLQLDLPRELPAFMADERRMQQVLVNLLGNAIKFTPEYGNITVRVAHFTALAALHDIAWQEHIPDTTPFRHGGFLLQVRDTGIGIPTSHLESIFEMFRQVDASVTRRYEGTGLGLALVKQLVELHGGVIWAESVEKSGTCFTCLLPNPQ